MPSINLTPANEGLTFTYLVVINKYLQMVKKQSLTSCKRLTMTGVN